MKSSPIIVEPDRDTVETGLLISKRIVFKIGYIVFSVHCEHQYPFLLLLVALIHALSSGYTYENSGNHYVQKYVQFILG